MESEFYRASLVQSRFSLALGARVYTAVPLFRGSPVPVTLPLSMALAMSLASPLVQSREESLEPLEQVRFDYAEVLRVQPVEQVITVGSLIRRCNEEGKCRQMRVPKDVRTIVAYDVDYTYRGTKYRSRLAEDPGRRLRIRIGITPAVRSRPRP